MVLTSFTILPFLQSPIFVLIPIFFALIIYYMVGFYPTFDAFLFTILVGIIISAVGVSYGTSICCFSNSKVIFIYF